MNGTMSWWKVGAAALLGLVPMTAALYVNSKQARKGPGKAAVLGGLTYGGVAVVTGIAAGLILGTVARSVDGLPRTAFFPREGALPNVGSLYLPRDGGLPRSLGTTGIGYLDVQRSRGMGLLDVNRSRVGLLDISRRLAGAF
jgi:hypothetical protein